MKKVVRVKKKGDPEKEKKKKKKEKKVVVDSKKHPRYKAYQDSLSLHESSDKMFKYYSSYGKGFNKFKKGSDDYKKRIGRVSRNINLTDPKTKHIKPEFLYSSKTENNTDSASPYYKKPTEKVVVEKSKPKPKPREKQKTLNLKSKGVDSKTPKPKAKKIDTDKLRGQAIFGEQNKKTPYNLSETKAGSKDKSNKQTRKEYRQHNLNPIGKPYPETKPEVIEAYDKKGLVNKKYKENQKKKDKVKKVVRVKKKDGKVVAASKTYKKEGILPKEAFKKKKK